MTNILYRSFQRLNITAKSILISKYSTAFHQDLNKNCFPPTLHEAPSNVNTFNYEPNLRTAAVPLPSIDLGLPRGIYQKNINTPVIKVPKTIIDPSTISIQPKEDKPPERSFNLPMPGVQIEKQAHRMLIIRRRKMKKHKLKKWRRKYKTLYLKNIQRKWTRREKAFRSEILAKIREAEEFDARIYVASRLQILDNVRFPTRYKGYLLPQEMIKQLMKEEEERRNFKKNMPKLTL